MRLLRLPLADLLGCFHVAGLARQRAGGAAVHRQGRAVVGHALDLDDLVRLRRLPVHDVSGLVRPSRWSFRGASPRPPSWRTSRSGVWPRSKGFWGFRWRPSAPFPSANGWGAAVGLLPRSSSRCGWWMPEVGGARWGSVLFSACRLQPTIMSPTGGLWISIGVSLVYFAVRRIRWRPRSAVARRRPGLVFAVLTFTPAGGLISERIERSSDSNDSRGNLYEPASQGLALQNRLVGHGAPKQVTNQKPPAHRHPLNDLVPDVRPPVSRGSGDCSWTWIIGETVRSARIRRPGDWWPIWRWSSPWCRSAIYGLLPQVVLIGVFAGLARRRAMLGDPSPGGEDRRPTNPPL